MEGDHTVLTTLDDQGRCVRLLGQGMHGSNEVVVARQHAGLAVVDDDKVNRTHDFEKGWLGDGDPQVHRIQHGQPLGLGLVNHAPLNLRVQVGTEQDRRCLKPVGDGRLEMFEHVEVGGASFCLGHRAVVGTLPTKGLTGCDFQPFEVQPCRSEQRSVFGCEIFAHDTDQTRGA